MSGDDSDAGHDNGQAEDSTSESGSNSGDVNRQGNVLLCQAHEAHVLTSYLFL